MPAFFPSLIRKKASADVIGRGGAPEGVTHLPSGLSTTPAVGRWRPLAAAVLEGATMAAEEPFTNYSAFHTHPSVSQW